MSFETKLLQENLETLGKKEDLLKAEKIRKRKRYRSDPMSVRFQRTMNNSLTQG